MLERYAPPLYAVFRIVFGFLYLVHGLQKFFGMFGGRVVPLVSLAGAAGTIELIAGGLIVIGLFTRQAAFIASGEMAAAYFISHFPRAFWPVENRGEPAALFCFAFLYMAARGAGLWSVDELCRRSPKALRT